MTLQGWSRILLPLLFFVVALMGSGRKAWAAVKLYLKDGSYQLVKSYEVHGNRVRYYSIERSEWEEVPAALVDFEATKRAQEEERTEKQKELDEVRKIQKERFERPAETGFEIAPGIHLPQEPGVFAFDGMRLVRMIQSSAEVVSDKKRRALLLALPAPVVKNRALVVLPGAKAAVRLSMAQPTFYANLGDGSGANLELITVKPGKEARLVEHVQSGIGVGKSGELRSGVPLDRTEIAPGLFKLKPTQALLPGEYALGEILAQQKLNLELWDFGVDKPAEK